MKNKNRELISLKISLSASLNRREAE
ncbi:hypothetical protein Goari_018110 [Gossypium aridum]|uniref:Uncharacterized protein n=1 Tax=Gossypium aridum TaxID=34290 RepID=A0A7J8WP15_GOSAI|nr:hypothetical protein [Gossypium aridum]